jgi:NitT/TauT family transport system substrate-binding protein
MSKYRNATHKLRRRAALVAVAAMVATLTTACGGGDDDASSDGPVKMRMATSLVDSLPFMTILQVAKDKGWFKEEGIDFEIIAASGGGDTAQALSSGAADIAITGPDAVLKLAEQSGGSIVTIGPWMNYNIVYWMAADGSVPLEGATLGVTGAGSTGEMIGKAVIAAKPDSGIKLVVAGGLGAQWAAAKSRQISGAYSASPASTALEQQEGAAVLVAARDIIGDIPMDLVAVQKSYADKHADAVKAFWKVIDRGWTYIREDTASAATDLNKIIKMDPDVLLAALKKEVESPLSYSIKVDCEALYNMSDVMIKGGARTEPIDWAKAIDQQYLPSEDQADCSGS